MQRSQRHIIHELQYTTSQTWLLTNR